MGPRIPFVDLRAQYLAHRQEFDSAIQAVIDRCAFVGGYFPRKFEDEFAATCGVSHCVGCANGTDAIFVVLKMLGLGGGDEVITTSMSWIATSETISLTGATPVFVDVDDCFGIDARAIEQHISSRTRAIVPVHLYGQPADMGGVMRIAQSHGLHVVEDCAQAHLATLNGQPVGTFGVAGTFSFFPGKNLGAYGDAGAIISNDATLADRCRTFANHGARVKHEHIMEGINSRLDGLQAALLSAKLRHLPAWTARRREIAARYDMLLADLPQVRTPRRRAGATHSFHLYVIETEERDALRDYLSARAIETQVHYPTPLPFLPAYSHLGHSRGDFPVAAHLQSRILSLPIYPEMEEWQIERVARAIRDFHETAVKGEHRRKASSTSARAL